MVIDYTIECISNANSTTSLNVFERIYFIILISYLLVKPPYLLSRASYDRSKIFLHRRLYSKTLESHQYGGHFYIVTSLRINLEHSCKGAGCSYVPQSLWHTPHPFLRAQSGHMRVGLYVRMIANNRKKGMEVSYAG